MEAAQDSCWPAPPTEAVVRTVRHEVGDLLQSLYATVALLQHRLAPELEQERRLLAGLRTRAEVCRQVLDATQDLVRPPPLCLATMDLGALLRELASVTTPRAPVRLETRVEGALVLTADAARLRQVGELLLRSACHTADRQVRLEARDHGAWIDWTVSHDGPGATPDELSWLERPFAHTRQALTGLALALARQTALAHGGELTPENPPEGGFRVRLTLPLKGGPAS